MILETVKKIEQYTKEDVLHLLDRVNLLFNKEPRLLQLPKKPLIFVGDTHGDWKATQRLLFRYWETATVFVFLGDYVDRGPHQIENINLLFELKTKIPNRLMILRGNHETPKVNRSYGFYDTVQETLGHVIDQYWQTFAKMPLAAISRSQKIFAVHGGIPEQLVDIKEINSLPREI
ncbi:MAG: metallophosphoesterase, partial [Candidatus Hermodarchaeia archaeon]